MQEIEKEELVRWTCRSCKGTGEVQLPQSKTLTHDVYPCRECDGTGREIK